MTPPCRRPSTPTSTELSSLLAKHKTGADYTSYTALTEADIKELTVSLDALSEQVSKVPGVVEAK